MYAIIRSGGKQYKVSEGESIRVEKLDGDVGKKVPISDVLFVHDGEKSHLGRPTVDKATVEATIVGHGRDKKIRIHKFKRRKGYSLTKGHRQSFTELQIDKISV